MNHPTKTYRVKGMHCASCAGIIEKTFKKTEGVHSAEVNYGTEKGKRHLMNQRQTHRNFQRK